MAANSQVSLEQQEQVLESNRDFIVKRLDADDLIDELIQANLIGQNAAQRVQLVGTSRVEKNRIIFNQLITCGPDALEKFCEILRRKKRQLFIAEQLEKCIHSTTTSEPATTVKCSPLDVSRLKARYVKILPTGKTDWPKHQVTQYVKLAIVKKEDVTLRDKHLNELTRLTLQGDVDKILKKKEPLGDLRDIFHYNNEPCPRLILIMGGPGVGKTTLCHELCLKWARDGFLAKDFDVIALIPLRSVQQRSLEDTIIKYIGEENYQQMKKSAGNRCLIILEGLDEITMNRQQSDPFLFCLIKECTILEEATILITSRPHACEEIDAGRRIEVVGFGNNEIKEFTEKSFPNDIQSVSEFRRQLDEYPQLHSLCYIPMNLVMLVDIFHCSEKKLPSTLTELYRLFIVMTLKRQVKKENVAKKPAACFSVAVRAADGVKETLCVMLRGISNETVGIVLCLSRLAYLGFFDWYCDRESESEYGEQKKWKEPKIIFTESDLMHCDIEVTSDFDGFGLLKASPTHELLTDINTYSFNHLTIQEFLCAIYISLQSQLEQLRLLREHFHEYPNVFTFVCGLTGLAPSPMLQFIYSKLTLPEESWSGDPNVIRAMRCINESKQSSGPHQSVSPFTLNLTGNTLLPYDCVCVSHVLSCYPVLALKMNVCYIGNKGAKLLVKHNLTGQLLEVLKLRVNYLTSEGIEHVMKIVRTSSATLRVLDVGINDIGDDGIAVISETLQHNKSLTTLKVVKCGLSVKGAVYISQLLNVLRTLQKFDMSSNDIGDDGMAVITEALQHNKSLTRLRVNRCGLSVKDTVYISQLLNVIHTLRDLGISDNDIGDDRMAVISEASQHNKSLTKLNVGHCGLSVKGAISISEMMMVNHSLQKLTMVGNDIGDDGISAIAGALDNCKIHHLDVQSCNITLIGARSLAAALSSNHTIRELWLGGNAITLEGALLILKSAVDNTVCQCVLIGHEYDENDEVKKMMNILMDRWRQYELLRRRPITESIMENNNNSRDEELVHELPIITGDGASVNMERKLMNQSEEDHSGGQEETRDHHHKQVSSSKKYCLLS